MVELLFRDPKGKEGRITESLDVHYDGKWQREVTEGLQRIAAEAERDDDEDGRSFEVYTQVVLELPEEAPVVEVEWTDVPVEAPRIER